MPNVAATIKTNEILKFVFHAILFISSLLH